MNARIEAIAMVKDYTFALTTGSYTICASLILNDMFNFIDNHTWIVGVIGWTITYFTNIYFHNKKLAAIDDKR